MRALLLSLLLMPLCASAAENTPEEAASTLWRALSIVPGGSADLAALKRIFHEDAVIFGGRYKEGAPVIRRSTTTDFLKPYERIAEKGFYECEISRVMQAYDRFAVV